MAKLTKRTVDATRPQAREFILWDSDVRGFGLRVWPTGRKVFVFRYQLGGRAGRTQRVTIGDYGTLTPDQARREAIRLRAEVAAGRDPSEERRSRQRSIRSTREAPTVTELADEFLTDRAAKKKPGTVAEYRRLLFRDVLPTLGRSKVAAVTRSQVAKLHLSMSDRPYLANRGLAILGAMFRFAELHDQRPRGSNPCTGIEPYPERARERFLSEAEFARLGAALSRAAREGLPVPEKLRRKPASEVTAKHRPKSADTPHPASPFSVAALRFLLLSGWREQEVLSLRWAALDFEHGIATLAETKTGRSVRHVGAAALALLSDLPRLEHSPYVFPGAKPGAHLKEIKRLWEAVRDAAALPDVRLHDLRHSFASAAAGGGLSLPVIGALLGHREVATTQRYAHLADDPRRRAADQVAAAIAAALAGPLAAERSTGDATAPADEPARVLPFARHA
jgi:integrase